MSRTKTVSGPGPAPNHEARPAHAAHTAREVSGARVIEARAEASHPSKLERLMARVIERIGGQAHARAVFGEAVSQEGVTVIPVARVFGGFGGGANAQDPDDGGGAGGAFAALPLGFIEIRNGEAHFRRINPLLGGASGPYGALLSGALGLVAAGVRRLRSKKVGQPPSPTSAA